MPRPAELTKRAPMMVRDALSAFGTELRLQLVRFYREHPRTSQVQAAADLGATVSAVSVTARHLVQLDVLTPEPAPEDGRIRVYTVNEPRVAQLRQAFDEYLRP